MTDKIASQFKEKYLRREKTYKLSIRSMLKLREIRKSACELLMLLLERTGAGYQLSDMVVTGTYQDFGYTTRQHFYRDRKILVDNGFIVYEGNDHYVSQVMIDPLSRRQRDYFLKKFGIKKEFPVNMGGNIGPPPPPPNIK